MSKKKPEEIRQQITDRIVAALANNQPPWRQPWSHSLNSGSPRNAISGRRYTGINTVLLMLDGMIKGYESQTWTTSHAWTKEVGAHVRKGEQASYVTLFRHLPLKDKATGQIVMTAKGKEKTIPLMREYAIFNVEQMVAPDPKILLGVPHPFGIVRSLLGENGKFAKREGVTTRDELLLIAKKYATNYQPAQDATREILAQAITEGIAAKLETFKAILKEQNSEPDFEPAEKFVAEVLAKSKINFAHRGTEAKYSPSSDKITMPSKRLFESMADYYQTLFHELIHATEKSTRVGQREGHDYCFGELVAEMGACFLLTELGVPLSEQMIPKSQSYLQNWLSKMGGDPKYVFAAASQASKATDYLLGFVGKQNPDYESPDDSEEEVSPERNAA